MRLRKGGRASQFVIQGLSLQRQISVELHGFVWVILTDEGSKDS